MLAIIAICSVSVSGGLLGGSGDLVSLRAFISHVITPIPIINLLAKSSVQANVGGFRVSG